MKGRLEEHVARLEDEEVVARGFLTVGVVWWSLVAAMSLITGEVGAFYGFGAVVLYLILALVVGLRFERTAAALLVIGAGLLIALGISMGWETGLWAIVGVSLIVEALISAGLMIAAREEEVVIERETRGVPLSGAHAS